MSANTTNHPVVHHGPDIHQDDNSRLWYSDVTGESAVRNIMDAARPDDYAVVDSRGNVLFRIKPNVLATVLSMFTFTHTRRGRGTIRAHIGGAR